MEGQTAPKKPRTDPTAGQGDFVDLENDEQNAEAEADAVLEQELRSAQAALDKENEEMLERIQQIEREYNIRKKPLYKVRGDVIQQIPGFWLHCFMQHSELKLVLGAVDQDILSNASELDVEVFDDVKSGYKIILRFTENDFFSDEMLTKEIRFSQEPEGAIQCSVTGCSPKWKADDPTRPETIKSGRKRGQDSIAFFRWFTQANNFEPGLVDTLAEIIRDQLWVNPLEFMDAEEDTEEPVMLEDDNGDDEEEEEEEDDDDDDPQDSDDFEPGGPGALIMQEELLEEPDLEDYDEGEEGEPQPGSTEQ